MKEILDLTLIFLLGLTLIMGVAMVTLGAGTGNWGMAICGLLDFAVVGTGLNFLINNIKLE